MGSAVSIVGLCYLCSNARSSGFTTSWPFGIFIWAFSQTNRRLWFPSVAANICIFYCIIPFLSVFCQIQRVMADITALYFCNPKSTDPVKIYVAIKPMMGQLKDSRDSQAHVRGCLHMMLQQEGCLTSAVADFEDHGQTKTCWCPHSSASHEGLGLSGQPSSLRPLCWCCLSFYSMSHVHWLKYKSKLYMLSLKSHLL